MLTRKSLDLLLSDIVHDLISLHIKPEKIILFGSYANGKVHDYSDIDLAIWSEKFSGQGLLDFELIRPIIRKYKRIDLKMYPKEATAMNYDPFINVIESTGRVIHMAEEV